VLLLGVIISFNFVERCSLLYSVHKGKYKMRNTNENGNSDGSQNAHKEQLENATCCRCCSSTRPAWKPWQDELKVSDSNSNTVTVTDTAADPDSDTETDSTLLSSVSSSSWSRGRSRSSGNVEQSNICLLICVAIGETYLLPLLEHNLLNVSLESIKW